MVMLDWGTSLMTESDFESPLHVHDLPQIWQKPSSADLLQALQRLALRPSTFRLSPDNAETPIHQPRVDPDGVPRYLTCIVASSLAWIPDDDVKEQIWTAASTRLSERSGRNAQPSMTREFVIHDTLTIALHEPSLTEDSLGLKTWTSSLLLSHRLQSLSKYLPSPCPPVLELGSGTGLVGIAASCLWRTSVVLTDLGIILPNLQLNLTLNANTIASHPGSSVSARALDWSDPSDLPTHEADKFKAILAADPIYSTEHPRLLVDTVSRWLKMQSDCVFIVELPLRAHYQAERDDLRQRLGDVGLEVVIEGTEIGFDDWQDDSGQPSEVECWWSVWRPSS